MIQFVCDSCGAIKTADEEWILGLAMESVGATAVRREVTLFPAWDEARARERFAVHFCSARCKDEYMAQLFGEQRSAEVTSDTDKNVIEMTRHQRTPSRRVRQRKKLNSTIPAAGFDATRRCGTRYPAAFMFAAQVTVELPKKVEH